MEHAQLLPAPVNLVADDNEGEVVGVARSRLEKTIGPNRRRGGGTAHLFKKFQQFLPSAVEVVEGPEFVHVEHQHAAIGACARSREDEWGACSGAGEKFYL